MKVLYTFLMVVIPLVPAVSAAAQGSAPNPARVYDNGAELHPGDVLKITVWNNPTMSGEFTVGVNGTLEHPLYQDVHVAGIPMPSVVDSLRTYLMHFEAKPQFVAVPLFMVTVSGQVRTPGLYSLPRSTTISQAIAQAGGVLDTGRLDKVRIVRGGHEVEADLTRADGPWTNEPVDSGDQIVVKKRGSFWTTVFLPMVSIAGAAASIINVARR